VSHAALACPTLTAVTVVVAFLRGDDIEQIGVCESTPVDRKGVTVLHSPRSRERIARR
jgi:hypothetical protein